jgi:ATP-dependent helicase/nuclease subunit A
VAARAPGLDPARRAAIAAEALRLLDDPDLAVLFGPEARAEVTLAGSIVVAGVPRPVHGRVDRIAVTGEAVWLADFKTGRPPAPGARPPRSQAAQVALYARLLGTIYPGRALHPLLVWTAGPVVHRLTPEECAAALDMLA